MDVCFVGMCVSLLDRRGLVFVAIGGSILNLILLTYSNYFYSPAFDAARIPEFQGRHGNERLRLGSLGRFDHAFAGGGAGRQAGGAEVDSRRARRRSPAWLGFFGCFAMGYVTLFVVADHFDPLEKIAYKRTLGRLGIIRGYLGPWIAEFYYLNDDRLMQQALERREFKSDQLTPIEIPLQIEPRLVIIQAESLDQNVIGFRVGGKNGQEVTPFLNRLRDQAMYFRVRVFHYQGSCDSDFTMLEGVAATPRVNAYSMPNYPFENSLPQILKHHGYHAVALHGYHSRFLQSRRGIFQDGLRTLAVSGSARTRFRVAGHEFRHHGPGSAPANPRSCCAKVMSRPVTSSSP